MINIQESDPNLLKIDKKSYKNIGICYIGYITVKDTDHVKIKSVNSLYIICVEADGSIECSSTEEKMEINTELLSLQIKTKNY